MFEITRELVSIALPPATAPEEQQAQGVKELAKRLKIDLALYDNSRILITSTNPNLPRPEKKTGRLNHKCGNLVWTFQLSDKRWIVAKAPQFRQRSALGVIGLPKNAPGMMPAGCMVSRLLCAVTPACCAA